MEASGIDITGGAGEQVVDILENIPSDSERAERRAASDGGFRSRFRRPAPLSIFRHRRGRDATSSAAQDGHQSSTEVAADAEMTSIRSGESSGGGGEQTAGESAEECRITAHDAKLKEGDIYNISTPGDDEPINPMSQDYIGIIASYFSVGLMIGGSTSILYPILIVKAGATSSLMTASYAVVMVFWSYKILFGFLSDCFPICGYKRKPYITIGVSEYRVFVIRYLFLDFSIFIPPSGSFVHQYC